MSRNFASISTIVLAALSLPGSVFAQQAADTCPDAPVIPVNTNINSSTIGATSDLSGSPCGFGDSDDVWYRFTAASAGTYVFDVFGNGIDPTLAIYSSCISGLLACNDDYDPFDIDPQVVLVLSANQTVYCRIAANFVDQGGFLIRVSFTGGGNPPPNDDCSAADLPVATVGVPVTGTNVDANTTISLTPATCGGFVGSGGGADVFVSFTPPSTGDYRIDTCGSSFDTVLSIHSACPASENNLLACNDDAAPVCPGSNSNSRIDPVMLTGGQVYYIRIAGYAEGNPATGNYSLLVTALGGAPGACCRGGTCAATLEADCTGPNTQWAGAGALCNAPGNTTNPCCKADYNHASGITVQDIFDFLIGYFQQSPTADINGDGSVTVQDIFDFLIAYFAHAC